MIMIKQSWFSQLFAALLIVCILLLASVFSVQKVENSTLYRQGRFVGSVLSQESIGLGDILGNTQNIKMTLQFAGAVTSAYINFELIPVNEAGTFAVILESVNKDIFIDTFAYQRKNLVIDGYSSTMDSYEEFLEGLRKRQYFESVSGDSYITTEDTIHFAIICVSASSI